MVNIHRLEGWWVFWVQEQAALVQNILNMKALNPIETSVDIYPSTHRKMPEDLNSHWQDSSRVATRELLNNITPWTSSIICAANRPPERQVGYFGIYVCLYLSNNKYHHIKSRRMRWTGHVARLGERRGVCRVLVGKPEGKRPLGRPRRRWEDNIKMDLQEMECGGTNWINLAQDRDKWRALVNAVMNLHAGNFLTS